MKVEYTKIFEKQFIAKAYCDKFIENFIAWKELKNETESSFFGKDRGYREPKLSNGQYLMHVHTSPIDSSDRKKWNNFPKKTDKTSNDALVYIKKGSGYFLIWRFINVAHTIPKMRTKQHKDFMDRLVKIADCYIDNDEIIENKKPAYPADYNEMMLVFEEMEQNSPKTLKEALETFNGGIHET